MRNNKKTAVKVIFLYLLVTTGLWMFLLAYSNSYNRLTTEKISPASLDLSEKRAEMSILDYSCSFDITKLLPESKFYYVLYMTVPDEVRLMSAVMDSLKAVCPASHSKSCSVRRDKQALHREIYGNHQEYKGRKAFQEEVPFFPLYKLQTGNRGNSSCGSTQYEAKQPADQEHYMNTAFCSRKND